MRTMKTGFPSKLRQSAEGWYVCYKRTKALYIKLDSGQWFVSAADAYHETTTVYIFEDVQEMFREWESIRLNEDGECAFCDGNKVYAVSISDTYQTSLPKLLGISEIYDDDEFFDWLFSAYVFADEHIIRVMIENAIGYARGLESTEPGTGYLFLGKMLEGVLDHSFEEIRLLRL